MERRRQRHPQHKGVTSTGPEGLRMEGIRADCGMRTYLRHSAPPRGPHPSWPRPCHAPRAPGPTHLLAPPAAVSGGNAVPGGVALGLAFPARGPRPGAPAAEVSGRAAALPRAPGAREGGGWAGEPGARWPLRASAWGAPGPLCARRGGDRGFLALCSAASRARFPGHSLISSDKRGLDPSRNHASTALSVDRLHPAGGGLRVRRRAVNS